jgi:restriction system protein
MERTMRKTIVQAIVDVMRSTSGPMTVQEVYDAIIRANLYQFNTDKPTHVVRSQIRRHCEGLDFPSASDTKYFSMHNGAYELLGTRSAKGSEAGEPSPDQQKDLLSDLHRLHAELLASFRDRVLAQLKGLDPESFELFSKRLLEAYGFKNVNVTSQGRDGGIDGFGRLRVGLAHLNVAFQCKRWRQRNVPRPEIDKFRGAIQGNFEQGLFFTTASFTKEAQEYSFRPGAVPIVLIDGPSIVDIMIEKRMGIEIEFLPVYSNALDLILSDDEPKPQDLSRPPNEFTTR